MNSKENSTSTPSAAMALAPRGKLNIEVDIKMLTGMSMHQLWALHDQLYTLGDVISGLLCQPRVFGDDNNYADAGKIMCGISEFISAYTDGVRNVALAAKPDATKEVECRAWMLLNFEARVTDDLASVAVLAAQSVKDVQSARFAEGRRK